MQYKNKRNLYKIVFITILLGFIISLAGCGWFPNGLFGIIDPPAIIKVDYTLVDLTEGAGSISLDIYSLNQVGFNASGFSYEYYYYSGTSKIPIFTKVVEASFYVEPSTSPGTAGAKSKIDNLPLYFQDLLDWLTLHPLVTEVNCDLNLIGIDDSLHSLTVQAASNLPVLQPGIDFYPPTARITTIPAEDEDGKVTGTTPFAVIFDASSSTDVGSGIESIIWDFGDGTTGTSIIESYTYATPGAYSVILIVADYYGNVGYDTVTIIANEPEAPNAKINTTPAEVSGTVSGAAPFEVYFDAYDSESEAEIISYSWDFGDGSSGTGITTNHVYSNLGTYTVILTATDSNGKKGYDSVKIEVKKALDAKINTTPAAVSGTVTGTTPFTVYFDAYESTSDSGIVSYSWDFGDGSSGTGITASHTYINSSDCDLTFNAILTITDSNGYKAYDSVSITIKPVEACP